MEDSRSNSYSMEEDIYWHNFHFAHFSLTLLNDFHHRLKLPKKFADYMRTTLPEQVVLKVNRVSWNVSLEKGKDDIALQGDGWKEFVNAYSLKKGDIMFFKYNRREVLEVLLFDGANSCEKEASYFVRKDHQGRNSDNGEEKNLNHAQSKDSKENPSKCHCGTPASRSRKNLDQSAKRLSIPTACTRESSEETDEMDKNNTFDEEDFTSEEDYTTPKNAATTRVIGRDSSFHSSRKRKHNDVDKMSATKKSIALHTLQYKSNRRPVTDEERKLAFDKAMDAYSEYKNAFVVVMRPSCVYKRFFLTIPAEWKPRNVFKKGEQIILRVGEKTWVCNVCYTKNNLGIAGGGVKDFARDNFLEEDDVCLFVPSDSIDGKYAFDVRIFRVVSKVVAPTRV